MRLPDLFLTTTFLCMVPETGPLMDFFMDKIEKPHKCDAEGEVCQPSEGKVCRSGSCKSACYREHLRKCSCENKEDNYCYLCCGSESKRCLPAHHYNIYQPNGEKWERDTCRYCVGRPDGIQCDDKNPLRLCTSGKCSKDICQDKDEGAYCDKARMKICVNRECINPCGRYLICDCEISRSRVSKADGDRCRLCCYNYAAQKCESAYKLHGITNHARRPIARTGLECRDGLTCNRYGTCSGFRVTLGNMVILPLLMLLQQRVFYLL